MLWAVSATTKRPMPLERDDEAGNIVITADGRAHRFDSHAAAFAASMVMEDADRGSSYIAHHARCPAGPAWRGRHRQPQEQGTLL